MKDFTIFPQIIEASLYSSIENKRNKRKIERVERMGCYYTMSFMEEK